MTVKGRIQKLENSCFTDREQAFEIFFKDFFSWSAYNIGMWIATAIMEFMLGIMMWFPYQTMQEEELWFLLVSIGILGATSYISPYLQFQEGIQAGRNTVRIYDKLQYLPISLKELQIYRVKKLAIFCFKMFLIFLVGQLFFSAVAYHEITWRNILYVTICGLVLPFGVGAMSARFSK